MKSKTISLLFILVAFLIIIIPAFYTVRKKHNNDLYLVMRKEVIEAANKCKNDNICVDDSVTLAFLIEKKYISKIYDPISKEAIDETSYVDFNKMEFIIN